MVAAAGSACGIVMGAGIVCSEGCSTGFPDALAPSGLAGFFMGLDVSRRPNIYLLLTFQTAARGWVAYFLPEIQPRTPDFLLVNGVVLLGLCNKSAISMSDLAIGLWVFLLTGTSPEAILP